MPMFARRYGVSCAACHTSPPRLNETGYQFRAAGFRMPDEIGTNIERPFKPVDYIGFRLQPRFRVDSSSIGSEQQRHTDVNVFAAEGYLWYGPISKHFSVATKVTFWPEESEETELNERVEGVVRFTYGKPDSFLDIRAGVPHPTEGFGGSESYSVSNSKPFIEELKTANHDQDTFYTMTGLHQAAATVGYYRKRTTVRAYITSGMRLVLDDEDGKLQGVGRKEPFSKSIAGSGKGGPDFQLFFNQILHPDGGNISLYYYKGQSFLPRLDLLEDDDHEMSESSSPSLVQKSLARSSAASLARPPRERHSAAPSDPFDDAPTITEEQLNNLPFFENDFHRLAFFAGYPYKKLSLLYGTQYGRDQIGSGGSFGSLGHFAEANVRVLNDLSVIGARVDWFDPSRSKGQNEMLGVTPFVNVWLRSQLRISAEYQRLEARRGFMQPNRRDNVFQMRFYWIK